MGHSLLWPRNISVRFDECENNLLLAKSSWKREIHSVSAEIEWAKIRVAGGVAAVHTNTQTQ